MSSSVKLPVTCPKCGKTAHTQQEVERLFGFRNMTKSESSSPYETRAQSWCKDCRSRYS